jgi:hypothetical protein
LAGDTIPTIVARLLQTDEYKKRNTATCVGTWSNAQFNVGKSESRLLQCPIGYSGSIDEWHQCVSANTWGPSYTTNTCSLFVPPPQNISAISTSNGIQVTWSPSLNADGYRVWREISPQTPTPLANVTATSYLDTSISSKNQYCYYLSATGKSLGGVQFETSHPFYACAYRP